MKKKGVSPVIATVLLIGIVMALALIVFIWMSTFIGETITKMEGQNIEIVCGDVKIEASYAGGQLSVFNTGNIPIYDMRIKTASAAGFGTENARKSLGEEWPKYGLNPGGTFIGTISLAGDVSLIPVLLGDSEKGKKVFVRVDYNVPFDEQGNITDDARIRATLPTINYLLDEGAKIILASHLGRPGGKVKPEFSLKPIAKRLHRLLNKEVQLAGDCIGPAGPASRPCWVGRLGRILAFW